MATVNPTPGEALLIWRRRNDWNQVQAAEKLGVHVDRYREWETDKLADAPRKPYGHLKVHETCFLLRRRAQMTQRALAKLLGCTRLWVIRMEEGTAPSERLKLYWKV